MLPADDYRVMNTMKKIRDRLWVRSDIGGVARYEDDRYHQISRDIASIPGNPWVISTLWVADHAVAAARSVEELRSAHEIFRWVVDRTSSAGLLAEQYNPYSGEPLSVSPLTWSHATFCMVINHYIRKYKSLTGETAELDASTSTVKK